VHLQLTNDENLSKGSVKMTACKIQPGNRESHALLEEVEPEFEVFSDQVAGENTDSIRKPKMKIKLKLRKCLLEVSVEEMYARRMLAETSN
jgi:hypothetical protein